MKKYANGKPALTSSMSTRVLQILSKCPPHLTLKLWDDAERTFKSKWPYSPIYCSALTLLDWRGCTVSCFKILKENFDSKHFPFPGYLNYLKITINGHKVYLDCSLDIRFVFAAVKAWYPKDYNFTKTLSPSQDLKSFGFL